MTVHDGRQTTAEALDQPLVSVIIPFLNGGEWLAECIDSVLQQVYPNLEIILIDDGSEKTATSIAREYCKLYPEKIQYIDHPSHQNRGVTASRNAGIKVSTGMLVAFLDADDKWLPAKLHNQVNLFRQYPEAAMICEASIFWYNWNDPLADNKVVHVGDLPEQIWQPPQLLELLYPLGDGAAPCPTGIIVKREALTRSGGFVESFAGEYQLYEDQAFLCKMYLEETVLLSRTANNMYRKRSGSLSGSADDLVHYRRVRKYFLHWFSDYLDKYNLNGNPAVQRVMQLVAKASGKLT